MAQKKVQSAKVPGKAATAAKAEATKPRKPRGKEVIMDGITYASQTAAAKAIDADPSYFGDCYNHKPGAKYGKPFDQFLADRRKPKNRARFEQSAHYAALKKLGKI